jgi:hypothetical protein
MSTDHIITNNLNGKFKCEYCGEEEEPPFMPAPINVIIDAMDYFMDKHEKCTPPPQETVMSEYIKGFDAGYDYVLQEIERYIAVYPTDVFVVKELLQHLKIDTNNILGKAPRK